jgi:hypothetical protein
MYRFVCPLIGRCQKPWDRDLDADLCLTTDEITVRHTRPCKGPIECGRFAEENKQQVSVEDLPCRLELLLAQR